MADCGRCKVNKREGLIGCEGSCKKWWHYSCANLSESDWKLLDKCKNVFYLCDSCKRNCEVMSKSQHKTLLDNISSINCEIKDISSNQEQLNNLIQREVSSVLEKVEMLFVNLKNDLQNVIGEKLNKIENVTSVTSKKSYANAVQNSTTFIVKPKDPKQNSKSTKSDILKNLNPVEANLNLTQVRDVSKGGIIVRCENDKFKELAKDRLGNNYTVQEAAKLNPRIKLVGLSQKFEEDALLGYLKLQNRDIFTSDSSCQLVFIKPLRKSNKVFQAMFQVDVTTYHKIMQEGSLFVGYDYCKVFDGIELRRCYACCGFHHSANNCSVGKNFCPRCAQEHKLQDCNNDHVLSCINCMNHNKKDGVTQVNVKHASWDNNCPVYISALESFKCNILNVK